MHQDLLLLNVLDLIPCGGKDHQSWISQYGTAPVKYALVHDNEVLALVCPLCAPAEGDSLSKDINGDVQVVYITSNEPHMVFKAGQWLP